MNRIILGDGSHMIARGTLQDGMHVIGIEKSDVVLQIGEKVEKDSCLTSDFLVMIGFQNIESLRVLQAQLNALEEAFELSQQNKNNEH